MIKNILSRNIASRLALLSSVSILSITACNQNNVGSTTTQSNVAAQLVVDSVSPVPIVNGNPAPYSVYIRNIGKSAVKGLSFSIANSDTKTTSDLKDVGAQIDGNNCSNIAANSSCSMNFVVPGSGTVTVLGKILNKQVLSFSTSTYLMTVQDSGDLASALEITSQLDHMFLTPNASIPGSYFGAMSFSVVNTHNGPIDVSSLFGTLPTNVTWSPINCPNPLPFGGVCQVRLTYNGPINSDVVANLTPSGRINGTELPEQRSKWLVLITKNKNVSLNRSVSLNLAFFASDGTTPITSLSVEQGLENPRAILKVTNTGNTGLTGITLPTVAGFTFSPDSSCSTLAEASSCNVGVTLSSANVIAATDITTNPANVVGFSYSNHLGVRSGSSDLPSLTYQVSAPNSPSISVSTSFSGCGGGLTSTSQTCNLNPGTGTVSGIAGGYKFIVTYTNSGSGAGVITVTPATIGNYGTATNNCSNVTLAANTGTCTVEYTLSNPQNATSANVPNGALLGTYSYRYGRSNQSNGSAAATNPNQVNVNITQSSLSLSLSSSSIQVGTTSTVRGIISNWYANTPAIPGIISITSGTPATASSTTASCISSGSGATCTGTLTGSSAGTANIGSNIIAPNGATIVSMSTPSPLVLRVIPAPYFVAYYPANCTVNNTAARVNGTCECIKDPATNQIWTAVGPNNIATTGSWNDWTGNTLNNYNSTAHCGLTGGWSLPSILQPMENGDIISYISSTYNPGGDWGSVATLALANGYTTRGDLASWMNNNGFKGIISNRYYWSSYVGSGATTSPIYMNGGYLYNDVLKSYAGVGVILVHSFR